MSLEDGIKRLEKKIDEVSEKLKTAREDGLSMTRRANLRARLDNLCEERDFYERKLTEETNNEKLS